MKSVQHVLFHNAEDKCALGINRYKNARNTVKKHLHGNGVKGLFGDLLTFFPAKMYEQNINRHTRQ